MSDCFGVCLQASLAAMQKRLLQSVHSTVAVSSEAGAAGGVWQQLLPSGRFSGRTGRGPYDTGDRTRREKIVAATLKRAGRTELVVDYDHQTVFGAVPKVGGRAPAAGWIKELQVRDAGIIGNSALRQMWDHFYFQAARIWYRHARSDSTGVAEALRAELEEVQRAIREEDPVALGYVQRNHIAWGLKRLNV